MMIATAATEPGSGQSPVVTKVEDSVLFVVEIEERERRVDKAPSEPPARVNHRRQRSLCSLFPSERTEGE